MNLLYRNFNFHKPVVVGCVETKMNNWRNSVYLFRQKGPNPLLEPELECDEDVVHRDPKSEKTTISGVH